MIMLLCFKSRPNKLLKKLYFVQFFPSQNNRLVMMSTTLALHTGIEDNVRFESTDHGKSVLAGLQHLREMQQLFDVILVAESREFPAHRVVLASCSDYFR